MAVPFLRNVGWGQRHPVLAVDRLASRDPLRVHPARHPTAKADALAVAPVGRTGPYGAAPSEVLEAATVSALDAALEVLSANATGGV
jgi:hypothetical protein